MALARYRFIYSLMLERAHLFSYITVGRKSTEFSFAALYML